MIREKELLDAIAECQGAPDPNAGTCRNLAAYYTILDHIKPQTPTGYSYTYDSGTEFSNAIGSLSIEEVLTVMDELMETLKLINPRLYASVIRKLS